MTPAKKRFVKGSETMDEMQIMPAEPIKAKNNKEMEM